MSISTENMDVQASRSPGQLAWGVWNMLQLVFTLLWTATLCSLVLLLHVLRVPVARLLRMAPQVWAPVLVAGAGARLVVEGGEDIDWSRPHLIVSNHQSVIDICALYMAVPVPLRFLLKDEMRKVPFVNWYARATGMLFLDRDSRRAGAIVRRARPPPCWPPAIACACSPRARAAAPANWRRSRPACCRRPSTPA